MNLPLDAQWGPYLDGSDARTRLCSFVDKVCASDVGVVWATEGGIFPLRAPRRDGGGFGDVLIFQWTEAAPPTPRPPSGFLPKLKAFINDCLEQEGKAAVMQGQADMAMGQAVDGALHKMFTSHRDDGAGVALDILCIGLSLALLPTGLGVLGVVGLIGGVVLLSADSAAYAMELDGDDKQAESFKRRTKAIRIVATVMTLPDIAYGGFKAIRELQEIKGLRGLDQATAATAESLAAKTTRASRASRYQQIAERAHLRAQIRTQQISAILRLEMTAKAAGAASTALLVREEYEDDPSAFGAIMSRLQVHSTTTYK